MKDEAMVAVEQWASIRQLLTGVVSDAECALHMREGVDALSAEGIDETRAGIEQMDKLMEGLAASFCHRQAHPSTGWREEDVERAARAIAGWTPNVTSWEDTCDNPKQAALVQAGYHRMARAALAALSRSAEPGVSREELVEALGPFSAALGDIAAKDLTRWPDNETIEHSGAAEEITWGDLRRARTLLAKERQDG